MSVAQTHAARNDDLHDLIGAGVDGLNGGVAVVGGNRIFLHETVAAMQLEALRSNFLLKVGAPVLAHRHFGHDLVAAHVSGEELVGERLTDLVFGFEFGQNCKSSKPFGQSAA